MKPMLILLDADFQERERLPLTSLRITRRLRGLHTAEATVERPIAPGTWVAVDTKGLNSWRVRRCETDGQQSRLLLEHGLAALRDSLLPDAALLTGSLQDKLTALLGRQQGRSLWRVEPTEEAALLKPRLDFAIGAESLLDALLRLCEKYRLQPVWTMGRPPWGLKLTRGRTETVRLVPGRNAFDPLLTRDRGGYATRIYPVGARVGGVAITIRGVNGGLPYVRDAEREAGGIVSRMLRLPAVRDPLQLKKQAELALNAAAESWQLELTALDAPVALGQSCAIRLGGELLTGQLVETVIPDWVNDPVRARLAINGTNRIGIDAKLLPAAAGRETDVFWSAQLLLQADQPQRVELHLPAGRYRLCFAAVCDQSPAWRCLWNGTALPWAGLGGETALAVQTGWHALTLQTDAKAQLQLWLTEGEEQNEEEPDS